MRLASVKASSPLNIKIIKEYHPLQKIGWHVITTPE